MSANGIHIQNY